MDYRVTDTLRKLNIKTNTTVKHKREISSSIKNKMVVNHGGVLNGFLFRKYRCDLGNYLEVKLANVMIETSWFKASGRMTSM